METAMYYGSADHQTFNPNTRNSKLIHHHSFSRENFLPASFNSMGILPPPAPQHYLSRSYPPYSSHLQQQQPPLLPLPVGPVRVPSLPPMNKKFTNSNRGRERDHSVTPKKSKNPKREGKISPKKVTSSNHPFGSGKKDQDFNTVKEENQFSDIFSGSVVPTISPPPSSLPLPSFSLRPKLITCKSEIVTVDTGATDNLRRLLRI